MRAIGYTVAWCGATALAVGVAWFGVSGVLRTALGDGEPLTPLVVAAPEPNAAPATRRDPPPSPEATASAPSPTATPRPRKKPTGRPAVAETTSPPSQTPAQTPDQTPPPAPRQSQAPKPAPSQDQPSEKLHTFTLQGGRAVVAVRENDCRIVSATPAEGWELKTWAESFWLRITFLRDGRESSAFCTWNALPPRLDTYET
ncbi:hypothetical protein [Herbidospora cretacea]|uniref:hypothetical protein n=1 Tax=Herbidospora cretacea TaxID=28444 RepID=UPI000AE3628A|nr:hypothetical protein [Herbidospora cretacea]